VGNWKQSTLRLGGSRKGVVFSLFSGLCYGLTPMRDGVPVAVEVEVGSCSLAENFSSQVVTIANKYLWYRQPTSAHHRSQVSVLVGGTCLGV